MANLRSQFEQALTNIEINGQKRKRAIDAHTEIRDLLQGDAQLKEWGVEPLLIGSYGRETGIYPGKDVDVFLRFTQVWTRGRSLGLCSTPSGASSSASTGNMGKAAAGHSSRHAASRSCSPTVIAFREEIFLLMRSPAVRNGDLWAIPTKDQNRWAQGEGRWVTTGAVLFGDLSTELNQSASSPRVGDRPAYKPIVKLVRQIRQTHLGDQRPGGLYLEFVTFEAWRSGLVGGSEWDVLLARTLQCIADRFRQAGVNPLRDPVLGTPVDPPLSAGQVEQAAAIFEKLAAAANRALPMNDTDAATEWRKILGGNDRANPVLPYPPNSGGGVGSTVAATGVGAAGGGGATTRRNAAPGFG